MRGGSAQTCHNIALRGEAAESPPEMRQPGREEEGDEMMIEEGIPTEDEMTRYEEEQCTLESLRKLTERNMPNTITFIPHRMRKRFARIYSAKINELSSHMWMGVDTPKREMLNLLVWAKPALLLSEDDTSIELHKEHHSKSASLNQRLAEAERDEWTNLIERARRKQQEEEEKEEHVPKPILGQRTSLPQKGEQSDLQGKHWVPESGEANSDGRNPGPSLREYDENDTGNTAER